MEHHVVRDLLPAHLAGELTPATAQEVTAHLDDCADCRSAADAAERPVALPMPEESPRWDEARLRRGVRRALWRTAFDAVSLLLVVAIVAWLGSAFVVQPFIARDGRAGAALTATFDLPLLRTPGARIGQWWSDADGLERVLRVEVGRWIGGEVDQLATVTSTLEAWSWSIATSDGNSYGSLVGAADPVAWQSDRLPAESVATVLVEWDEPQPAERVEVPQREGIALLWAAYDLRPALAAAAAAEPTGNQPVADPGRPGPGLPGWSLGYSACQAPRFPSGIAGIGSAGGSGPFPGPGQGGSLTHALEQLRRATANLADTDDLRIALEQTRDPAFQRIGAIADWLEIGEPEVVSVVVTGTVDQIDAFVAASGADAAWQLGAELYNGEREGCS